MSGNPYMRLISKGVDIIDPINTKIKSGSKFETNIWLGNGYYDIGRMGSFSYIGENALIMNVKSIGRYCSIARNVIIGESEHPSSYLSTSPIFYNKKYWKDREFMQGFYRKFHKQIIENDKDMLKVTRELEKVSIGHDVWIGEGVFIRKGVTIGHGAILASRAVITKDVAPYSIVGGIPAKIIKQRFSPQTIQRLLEIKWWEYDIRQFDDVDFKNIFDSIEKINNLIKHKNIKKYKTEEIIF